MRVETGEYFTLVYGVIDTRTEKLHFAGAGHPHPVLVSAGRPVARLATDGFPIGFVDEAIYQTETVDLRPGDRLCLFSDGAVEARDVAGTMYGSERLVQRLQEMAERPIAEVVDGLAQEIHQWTGSAPSQDDVALILLQFAGKSAKKTLDMFS